MPATETTLSVSWDDIRKMIETADDMPTSTKILCLQNEVRHRDTMDEIRKGFERAAKATEAQTKANIEFGKRAGVIAGLAGLGGFVLLLILILMLGDTRGADIEKATDGTVKVLEATRGVAEAPPGVPASPASPEK